MTLEEHLILLGVESLPDHLRDAPPWLVEVMDATLAEKGPKWVKANAPRLLRELE